jgi:hypothetical protein
LRSEGTGCLLTHIYGAGETTLKWDPASPLDPDRYGTADNVQVPIGDITRGQLDHRALFEAFQIEIAAGGAPQKGS